MVEVLYANCSLTADISVHLPAAERKHHAPLLLSHLSKRDSCRGNREEEPAHRHTPIDTHIHTYIYTHTCFHSYKHKPLLSICLTDRWAVRAGLSGAILMSLSLSSTQGRGHWVLRSYWQSCPISHHHCIHHTPDLTWQGKREDYSSQQPLLIIWSLLTQSSLNGQFSKCLQIQECKTNYVNNRTLTEQMLGSFILGNLFATDVAFKNALFSCSIMQFVTVDHTDSCRQAS